MRVQRAALSFIALLAVLAAGGSASGQQNPNAPQAWETTTIPVGGKGVGVSTTGWALRCSDTRHAIIGAIVRKGTVIDYLQILCAPVVQDQRGAWGWFATAGYGGPGAGNPNGGGRTRQTVCDPGYAVVGFMATATLDDRYLQDFRFECGRIVGIKPDAFGRGSHPDLVDVNMSATKWAGWVRLDGGITSSSGHFRYRIAANDNDDLNLVGRSRPLHQARCGNAASAVYTGVGGWWVAGGLGGITNVVQVLRMYCRGGSVSG